MKLRHLLPAIALAFPLVSQAETEFSYDYVELAASRFTAELNESNDDLNANRLALKFNKELPFQLLIKAALGYQVADNTIDLERNTIHLKQNGYAYRLHFGRYFEIQNRVNALLTVVHSRGHSQIKQSVTGDNVVGEVKFKNNDVSLSNGIDAGLRIHLDNEKRFELSSAIRTRFDGDGTDTAFELGFGFKAVDSLQLIAEYLTESNKEKSQNLTVGARWNF